MYIYVLYDRLAEDYVVVYSAADDGEALRSLAPIADHLELEDTVDLEVHRLCAVDGDPTTVVVDKARVSNLFDLRRDPNV